MYYPSRDEFRSLSKQGNLIPVYCELSGDCETVISAFRKLAYENDQPKKYAFLLESVVEGKQVSRYSFMGVDPKSIIVHNNESGTFLHKDGRVEKLAGANIFDRVQKYLERFDAVKTAGLAPFSGGAVGYAGFEVIEEIEPSVIRPKKDVLETPDAVFMIVNTIIAFDHVTNRIQIIAHAEIGQDVDASYDEAVQTIEGVLAKLREAAPASLVVLPDEVTPLAHTSNKTKKEFMEIVETTKEYIYNGDMIQAVLSQRFEAELDVEPLTIHRALRMVNPSPYMFCLHLDDLALVGASPEIHARCKDSEMLICPIAGTRVRGKDVAEDDALAEELLADEKERAEHLMLVDLARNDLGRIAQEGTVKVSEFMHIERYSHVMHIVSNVTGVLKSEKNSSEVMSASFPAGTLSGAPKVRAMQIISELEKEKRGPYGGTVAYFSYDGNIDSCITIRTALLKDGKAYIQSGAGIVADSDPVKEFEETQNKARGMMTALGLAKSLDS